MSQELHHALGAFHSNLGNLLGHIDQMEPNEIEAIALVLNAVPGGVRQKMAKALSETEDVDPTESSRRHTDLDEAREKLIMAASDSGQRSIERLRHAWELLHEREVTA